MVSQTSRKGDANGDADLTRCRIMTVVLAVSCQCVTCCSSMASDTYAGLEAEFGVSQEVCILTVSLFVAGLGVGPREFGDSLVAVHLGIAR